MTKLGYVIEDDIKNDFEEFVINEHGFKKGKCNLEIEKAMKLQLAINGNEKYINDPDVQKLKGTIFEKSLSTHTRKSEDKVKVQNEDDETNLEDEVKDLKNENEKIQNELKEIKAILLNQNKYDNENQRYKENPPITANTLTNKPSTKDQLIVNDFISKYGDYNQVSRNDLTELIMNTGLTNRQTINNKITYLKSRGFITPVNPNVFNVVSLMENNKVINI
jgi:hypothetical protein